jgi:2-keto-4-pentenoate hydratase/2-oxohepta-3-ene-1,7-dioic acid hydratase in catechol pathway
MRLCRFNIDDVILCGFYADDHVIPIDQTAEAYFEHAEVELELPSTSDLLDLLPPDGPHFESVLQLSGWLDGLSAQARRDLGIPIADVELLTPIGAPRKVLLLAGNYAEHIVERGGTSALREETFPYVFMKPPTTLSNPGGSIVLPRISRDHVDWECELGVVIGRTCRDVDEDEAPAFIAGYTVVNDISDRKFQPNPARKPRDRDRFFDWLHGKWHDTFCPVGPCILSADVVEDPQKLRLRLTLNDELKQAGSTAQMIFPVAAIVSFLSRFITLEPGDLISTGTPAGVGSATETYLKPGDVLRATIDGIGTLENPVVAEA